MHELSENKTTALGKRGSGQFSQRLHAHSLNTFYLSTQLTTEET